MQEFCLAPEGATPGASVALSGAYGTARLLPGGLRPRLLNAAPPGLKTTYFHDAYRDERIRAK